MASTTSMTDTAIDATRGLRDPRTWQASGYVLVSTLTLASLFVVALVMLVVAVPLALVGIGLPVLLGAHSAIDRLVGFERRRAGWVGERIARRPSDAKTIRARALDPVAWRNAGFAMIGWVVAAVLLALVAVLWGTPLFLLSIPIWAWAVDASAMTMIVLPALGAALLCIVPWPVRGAGLLLRRFVEVQVGPDRLAAMEEEVSRITESRSEILSAVAGERRRIERNLHDGVQQQLVALGIDLGLAESKMETDPAAARELLADARRKTRESIGELRTIGRGLHPAILGDRGLDAALSAVVANAPIPIELRSELTVEPPPDVAEAAYFVVSEAVTNVMKHSRARVAVVDAHCDGNELVLSVYDDGRGGASITGTGLAGIAARVRGFGGVFDLDSPAGGPTVVRATIPWSVSTTGGSEPRS